MKKKIGLLILLLSLVAVGLLLLAVYPYRVVIKTTDQGFVPESITVPKGTVLDFISEGSNPHWPASNYHPTHTLYPVEGGCIGSKFDACKGLKAGEQFNYQINLSGEWPIHDHIYPEFTGLVKVTATSVFKTRVQSILNIFFKKTQSSSVAVTVNLPSEEEFKNANYSTQVSAIKSLSQTDPIKAWDYLKKAYTENGVVVGNAHELAHLVGNGLYVKYGVDGVLYCDTTFAFGCFHGVTQKLLEDKGPGVVSSIQDKCVQYFPPPTQGYTGCIHGMGHGLYTWEHLNATQALKDCDQLSNQYKPYCYDGVFMEHASDLSKNDFDSNHPWQFCESLDQVYGYNCARYQAQTFLAMYNSDLIKMEISCNKTTNQTYKTVCLESMGYYITQNTQGDLQKILKQCQTLSSSDGASCLIGASRETIFQKYAGWQTTSNAICQTLSNTEDKNMCLKSNDAEAQLN